MTGISKILAFFLALLFFNVNHAFAQPEEGISGRDNPETFPVFSTDPVLKNIGWEKIAGEAPWGPRDSHAIVVFNGKLWVMGGINGNDLVVKQGVVEYWKAPHKSDVWSSADGKNWELITESAPWGGRRSSEVIVFNGKMWLMGGWGPDVGYRNDIWSSEDGLNWKQEKLHAEWDAREGHELLVYHNKLWLIGGVRYDLRETKNDVWSSENGIDWKLETGRAGWSSRWDHAAAVFQNKIWLVGGMDLKGGTFKDIWTSENGADWGLVSDTAPFAERQGHALLEFRNHLWLIGRLNDTATGGANDIWYSADGYLWQKAARDPEWLGREDHAAIVFNERIWVMGGMKSDWRWSGEIMASVFPDPKMITAEENRCPQPGSSSGFLSGIRRFFSSGDSIPADLAEFDFKDWNMEPRCLRSFVIPYIEQMARDAEKSEISLGITSGYENPDYGFFKKIWLAVTRNKEEQKSAAIRAEHRLGTVIDFPKTWMRYGTALPFESTVEAQWIRNNAHKYGFVMTGGDTEPWHYRFVGIAASKARKDASDDNGVPAAIDLDDLNLSAQSYSSTYLSKNGFRKTIVAKSAERRLPIASISKLMTALVALENFGLQETIRIDERAVSGKGISGTIKPRDVFSVKTLLEMALVESNNDAARALALKIGEKEFVALMNRKASDLGMTSTRFYNASGVDGETLSDTNYSTAGDLTILSAAVLHEHLEIFWMTAVPEIKITQVTGESPRIAKNTNQLISSGRLPAKITGGKTGETPLARQNLLLITETPKGGHIIHIVLGSGDRFGDMEKLVNYVYQAYNW